MVHVMGPIHVPKQQHRVDHVINITIFYVEKINGNFSFVIFTLLID